MTNNDRNDVECKLYIDKQTTLSLGGQLSSVLKLPTLSVLGELCVMFQ